MQSSKNTNIAIIEIDEGSIPRVLNEVTPSMMVFTNFFRDQMDRFGEIDIMVDNIAKSISNKGIKLLLNADDPFVSRLKIASHSIVYYGMKNLRMTLNKSTMNESKYCLIVDDYCNMTIYIIIKLDIITVNVDLSEKNLHMKCHHLMLTILKMIINQSEFNMKIAGDFNSYNAIAAYTVLRELGLNDDAIRKGFETYTSDNGRMQYFSKIRRKL